MSGESEIWDHNKTYSSVVQHWRIRPNPSLFGMPLPHPNVFHVKDRRRVPMFLRKAQRWGEKEALANVSVSFHVLRLLTQLIHYCWLSSIIDEQVQYHTAPEHPHPPPSNPPPRPGLRAVGSDLHTPEQTGGFGLEMALQGRRIGVEMICEDETVAGFHYTLVVCRCFMAVPLTAMLSLRLICRAIRATMVRAK